MIKESTCTVAAVGFFCLPALNFLLLDFLTLEEAEPGSYGTLSWHTVANCDRHYYSRTYSRTIHTMQIGQIIMYR